MIFLNFFFLFFGRGGLYPWLDILNTIKKLLMYWLMDWLIDHLGMTMECINCRRSSACNLSISLSRQKCSVGCWLLEQKGFFCHWLHGLCIIVYNGRISTEFSIKFLGSSQEKQDAAIKKTDKFMLWYWQLTCKWYFRD